MKKIYSSLAVAAVLTSSLFTSCGTDAPDSVMVTVSLLRPPLDYNSDGVWVGWNSNDWLYNAGFAFSHRWTDWGGGFGTSQGFVASVSTDNSYHEPMYEHQFTVMPQGGPMGLATPFLVANWDTTENGSTPCDERTCLILNDDERVELFRPATVMITNTCYTYYTMMNGNDFCGKFGKGDWLSVTAHGVHADGAESTSTFMLANLITGSPQEEIVNSWRTWNLTSLGEVCAIYFTMDSSDSGMWGMNTPAYFALANLTAEVKIEN